MSETKFTRGPWRVSVDADGEYAITKDGSFITYSFPTELGFEQGTTEANAHLIAAAPDLYEALENVLHEIKSCIRNEEYYFGSTERFDIARTALAKARGETP